MSAVDLELALHQALGALKYHREQTRPIDSTTKAIEAAERVLNNVHAPTITRAEAVAEIMEQAQIFASAWSNRWWRVRQRHRHGNRAD